MINSPTPVSGLKSALLNGTYISITRAYYIFIRSVYVLVFARVVGVEIYGYYAYAQNWYLMFIPLSAWGMNELLGARASKSPQAQLELLVGTSLSLRMLFSIVSTLLLIIAACLWEPDSSLLLLILIYSQGVIAKSLSTWIGSLLTARERSQIWLAISIPFLTFEVLLVLGLAFSGAELVSIALAQCIVWWLTLFCACLVYRRAFETLHFRFSVIEAHYFFYNGAILALSAFLLSCFGPGLLIAYRYLMPDVAALGEVALVIQILFILGQSIKMISNSALPQLNRLSEHAGLRQDFFALTIWHQSLYLGGAFFLTCYTLLMPVTVALAGEEFRSSALLFSRYAWIVIPLSIMQGWRLNLISNGKTSLFLLSCVAGLVFLTISLGVFAMSNTLNTAHLFLSLGVAYSLVALLVVVFVLRLHAGVDTLALMRPLLILLATLLVFFTVLQLSIGMALAVCVAILGAASLNDIKGSRIRLNKQLQGELRND